MPSDSSVERFIKLLLFQAHEDRATEIIIAGNSPAAPEGASIRYRVDGAWYDMAPFPQEIRRAVLDKIMDLAGLAADGEFPMEGVFEAAYDGQQYEWHIEIEAANGPCAISPVTKTYLED